MRVLALVLALASATAAAPLVSGQEAGRITRIEFRPATSDEGGGVIITLVGAGSCSYTIDYGDGQSEKRPTAMLPDRLRHSYPEDGEYVVVATPDPPCEGVARARLDVRAINQGVWSLAAEPGVATENGTDVAITINGRGQCAVTLEFGDGASERVEGELPLRRMHRYPRTGTFNLRAVAASPCRGEASLKLDISR